MYYSSHVVLKSQEHFCVLYISSGFAGKFQFQRSDQHASDEQLVFNQVYWNTMDDLVKYL